MIKPWTETYRTKIETDGISVTRKSDRAAIMIPFDSECWG